MAEAFGLMSTERGERLSNDHFSDRFTCPGCHTEHHQRVCGDARIFVRCGCGAPLVLHVELIPSAICTIADEDEEMDA